MIEIIYKDDVTETKSETTVKTPKNIRQIGNNSSNKKIYIEDYVMTYLKRTPKNEDIIKYGVLLGTMKTGGGYSYIFVNGVVEAPITSSDIKFDDKTWAGLYGNIKKYFGTLEIVGWFLSIPYKMRDDMTKIQKVHLDNFAGIDKICFFNDRTENEDGFYIYENNRMNKQPGYYIYYDRNDNMQKYFIENDINEEALPKESFRQNEGSFRAILNEKSQPSKPNSQLIKAGAMVAIVALLVTAIASMNNYGDIRNINGAINKLASVITNDSSKKETTDNTVIEVAGSEIQPTTKEQQATDDPKQTTEKDTTAPTQKATKKPKESESAETEPNKQASTGEISYYTVKDGETLFEICMKIYNDANMLEKMRTINKLDKNFTIVKGQKIILP